MFLSHLVFFLAFDNTGILLILPKYILLIVFKRHLSTIVTNVVVNSAIEYLTEQFVKKKIQVHHSRCDSLHHIPRSDIVD